MILCYAVITMEKGTHGGSRQNLLGKEPDPKLIELLSNEKQVTRKTPPTFLFSTGDDSAVPVENSLNFYEALRKAGVPAALHIYEHGPHGVGLAQKMPELATWPDLLAGWMSGHGWLTAPGAKRPSEGRSR
jgi:acetyl esterase/lipase